MKLLNMLIQNNAKRLFVDLDGTLCEWKKCSSYDELFEEGYFYNLKPQKSIIDEVKNVILNSTIEVFTLSAVLPEAKYAKKDKNDWLDKFLPEIPIEKRLFSVCGEDKTNAVPGYVQRSDFLLDDYSVNLSQWAKKGNAIKVLNGINGNFGTWKGLKIKA